MVAPYLTVVAIATAAVITVSAAADETGTSLAVGPVFAPFVANLAATELAGIPAIVALLQHQAR